MAKPKQSESPVVTGLILLILGGVITFFAVRGASDSLVPDNTAIWIGIGAVCSVGGLVLFAVGIARIAQGVDYLVRVAPEAADDPYEDDDALKRASEN
ncbi:hypothetical protein [Arthrobacter tecti]